LRDAGIAVSSCEVARANVEDAFVSMVREDDATREAKSKEAA
jgi:hypothetical protein